MAIPLLGRGVLMRQRLHVHGAHGSRSCSRKRLPCPTGAAGLLVAPRRRRRHAHAAGRKCRVLNSKGFNPIESRPCPMCAASVVHGAGRAACRELLHNRQPTDDRSVGPHKVSDQAGDAAVLDCGEAAPRQSGVHVQPGRMAWRNQVAIRPQSGHLWRRSPRRRRVRLACRRVRACGAQPRADWRRAGRRRLLRRTLCGAKACACYVCELTFMSGVRSRVKAAPSALLGARTSSTSSRTLS